MKVIGSIPQNYVNDDKLDKYAGGIILQFTEEESKALYRLLSACEGMTIEDVHVYGYSTRINEDVNTTKLLATIQRYYEMKFAINEFRQTLDALEREIDGDGE